MALILTDENFEKEVNIAGKLAMVDFFATWCEPCSMLAPVLEKIAENFSDKVVLMKANIDEAQNTAGKFGVEKIPTVILFENGKPISGFVGLASQDAIAIWLETAIAESYAKTNKFKLNPDKTALERVIKGLLENEKKYGKKYCPCRRVSGDAQEDAKKICPCAWHKEEISKDGHCLCNLYFNGN